MLKIDIKRMIFGPLHQFDLNELSPFCAWDLGLIPIDTFIFIIVIVAGFTSCWQVYEFFFEWVQIHIVDFDLETLIKDLIKKVNYMYIDNIITIFIIIFCCNIIGLLPYTQTLTAQLICTLFLALFTILTIWLHSLVQLKMAILNHFIPAGTPLVLAPFIISIEIISNASRIISLSVRLFANITSGHALLKILAGFGLLTLSITSVWKFLLLFPWVIILIITFLELLIAGLQTYVFVTLILIYISEFE